MLDSCTKNDRFVLEMLDSCTKNDRFVLGMLDSCTKKNGFTGEIGQLRDRLASDQGQAKADIARWKQVRFLRILDYFGLFWTDFG